MEDIGLVKQGWKWMQSQKQICSDACSAMRICVEKIGEIVERHWPLVCSGCGKLLGLLRLSIVYWKDCILRGFRCSAKLGSSALLLIMWSCFLSLTSLSCLVYVLLSMVLSQMPLLSTKSLTTFILLIVFEYTNAGNSCSCCFEPWLHTWALYCRTIWYFGFMDVCKLLDHRYIVYCWRQVSIFML